MVDALRLPARILAIVLVLLSGLWGGLFLWYRVPGGPVSAGLAAAGWALGTGLALYGTASGRWTWAGLQALALTGLMAWFVSIRPTGKLVWAEDVSRLPTAAIGADEVVVDGVRDFAWRAGGHEPQTARWETRRYRIADLDSVDLLNSYWAGPHIAHTIVSFGFRDGRHLAVSIEIRRQRGEEFSNLAGVFKRYELAFVAAEERDVIGVRTLHRGEDVQLFRLKVTPEQARGVFLDLLGRASRIAAEPTFYDTLPTNCTTETFGAARTVAHGLLLDWRVIVSGYLPDYAYDLGLLDIRYDLPTLRRLRHIRDQARAEGGTENLSQRIRVGVPDPNGVAVFQ